MNLPKEPGAASFHNGLEKLVEGGRGREPEELGERGAEAPDHDHVGRHGLDCAGEAPLEADVSGRERREDNLDLLPFAVRTVRVAPVALVVAGLQQDRGVGEEEEEISGGQQAWGTGNQGGRGISIP